MIRSSSSRKSDLHFDYDAMPARRNEYAGGGNRICKIVKPRNGSGVLNQAEWTYTYYTRDAQGNVIAVYERDYMYPGTNFFDELTLKENDLYGSSRVGLKNDTTTIASRKYTFVTFNSDSTFDLSSPGGISAVAAAVNSFTHALGRKSYELVNHLGNVLVVVSDSRTVASNSGGNVTAFAAVVNSAEDFYSFGNILENRSYQSTSYKYSFNGKEDDDETGWQDYGMRIYNPSLGRFLSVDMIASKYPMLSPYQFASNTPIFAVDVDGLEASQKITNIYDANGNLVRRQVDVTIKLKVVNHSSHLMTPEEIEQYVQPIKQQTEASFSGSTTNSNGVPVVFNYNVQFEVVDQVDPNTDFYIEIVDQVKDQNGNVNPDALGKADKEGDVLHNRLQIKYLPTAVSQGNKNSLGETGAHEIGHILGLQHAKDETGGAANPDSPWSISWDPKNLMRSSPVEDTSGSTHLMDWQKTQAEITILKTKGQTEIVNVHQEKK